MRKRLGVVMTILVAIGVLVAINSLAYVREEEKTDSELSPNRSTYHAGATGTRALYEFLSETGHHVMRWREAPEKLLGGLGDAVETFVIVGDTRVGVTNEEAENLLLWVAKGGRLVLIDRRPEAYLLPPSAEWRVTTEYLQYPMFDTDPNDPQEMTEGMKPLRPSQASALGQGVESVMPSKFYSAIKFSPSDKTKKQEVEDTEPESEEDSSTIAVESTATSPAPVAHLSSGPSTLLVDYPHGKGRIVLLSDPFIVANRGIALNDNLQLATNLLAPANGVIAFDEFHQGRAITRNAFVGYFAGTPVLAIAGQIALLVIVILWTRGRRFGRPLPLAKVDRRSSLEFVASMAELQQRAKAFDLAIENVYSRTRRILARYGGVDYSSARSVIAERVASRSSLEAHQLETIMRQSEEAINGGAVTERQAVHLVSRLREIETALGLRMRSRDVKQSAQNI